MVRYDINTIKKACNIIDVISEHVVLRRSGGNYFGLCPFHEEKTPSFSVNPEKQIYHCFGCQTGGDVIGFVMNNEGLNFPEALEQLANRGGIQPNYTGKENKEIISKKNNLYAILEEACVFFQTKFSKSPAEKYAINRKINEDAIAHFRLGYAPDSWDNLGNYLSGNFNPQDIEEAGLIIPRKTSGHYDRFRNKLMFPISDNQGRIIGFAGRALEDSKQKYTNTPETSVFQKRKILYGLDGARKELKKKEKLFVVEGYTDVIQPWQNGFKTFVATGGTAFSRDHVEMINELAKRFDSLETILCFDGDSAGRSAAARAVGIAIHETDNLKVCSFPNGEDPAGVLEKGGKKIFEKTLNSAGDGFDFCLDYYSDGRNMDIVSNKMGLLNRTPVREIVCNQHPRKQEIFISVLAEKLKLTKDNIRDFLEIGSTQIYKPLNPKNFSSQESMLREIFANDSETIMKFLQSLEIGQEYFKGVCRKIFECLSEDNGDLSDHVQMPLFENSLKNTLLAKLNQKGVSYKSAERSIEKLFDRLPKPSQKRLELAVANLVTQESLYHEQKFLRKGGSLVDFLRIKKEGMENLKR
ncbi:MAG: DNA primase [Candidatus Pacearchaeota archaeon]|jgi:DNA primase